MGQTGRVTLVLGTSAGGVGAHVRSLIRPLSDAGYAVEVCGPASTEDLFGFRAAGARFAPVEIASGPHPVADARAAARLRRLAAGTDLVHAHGLRAGLVAGAAMFGRHTPLVVTWHNRLSTSGARGALNTVVERVVARRATVTLTASEELLARVLASGGRDVRPGPVAAPNLPRPTRTPAEVRAELGAGEPGGRGRPVVLAVARLHPDKGLDLLVAAAARWVDRDPVPLVVIAGDGPLAGDLAQWIAERDAPVRPLGRRDDIADLLAAADVVVLPSRSEVRPLAAQEALRAGRPLVATTVGGVPEVVGDGGVLIPPDDVDALDRAVRHLLDDPDEADAVATRAAARGAELITDADTAERVLAVYAELLGR